MCLIKKPKPQERANAPAPASEGADDIRLGSGTERARRSGRSQLTIRRPRSGGGNNRNAQ